MIPVVPFDHPHIVSGQGTIGLEIAEQRPDADVVIVPLSGGGLLAGIALAVKSLKPDVEVVGVSIEQSPAMLRSLEAGKPVQVEEKDTLADSLLGGIGQENHYTLPLIQQYVDTHVTVTEDEVANGMRYAFYQHGLVIEGAAAVSLGAVLAGKIDISGKQVVSVISGCNVDYQQYLEVIRNTAAD
jgi:threonine dehydratase